MFYNTSFPFAIQKNAQHTMYATRSPNFPVVVRLIGLEPTRITTPDPKSGASTNFATSAKAVQSYTLFFELQVIWPQIIFPPPHHVRSQYVKK